MILTSFKAKNFRNIERCDIAFQDGVQLLIGDNAQGKTNAVEGIYLFARGRSFRTASDRDMVRFSEDGFSVEVTYTDKQGPHTMTYTYYKGQRKRTVNGYEVKRVTDMIGHLRAVLFTPDHLRLVKDSPEERRSFLNVALSQCYPAYVKVYADLKRAQDERNCLLKQAQKGLYFDKEQIDAWSYSLAEYSARIYLHRKEYLKKLKVYGEPILSRMTDGKEELTIVYKSDIEIDTDDVTAIREQYVRVYSEELAREIGAGVTLFGPTRDDIELYINEQSVRHFASQGQQRSVVLALKLAEGEVCRDLCGEDPVYIFDDVLSELDSSRRAYLFKEMKQKQLILTGCESVADIPDGVHRIKVEKGTYVSAYR